MSEAGATSSAAAAAAAAPASRRDKKRRHRRSSKRRHGGSRLPEGGGGERAGGNADIGDGRAVQRTPRADSAAAAARLGAEAPPPPGFAPQAGIDDTGGAPWGIVVVVVLVCVTALGVASWTMRGARVAMVAVEGHAGVGHTGGVPTLKLSPDAIAGKWNQHDHKWRPQPNPAVDCAERVRERYGAVSQDEWLGVIGTLMADNPGISRFYSQVRPLHPPRPSGCQ